LEKKTPDSCPHGQVDPPSLNFSKSKQFLPRLLSPIFFFLPQSFRALSGEGGGKKEKKDHKKPSKKIEGSRLHAQGVKPPLATTDVDLKEKREGGAIRERVLTSSAAEIASAKKIQKG